LPGKPGYLLLIGLTDLPPGSRGRPGPHL